MSKNIFRDVSLFKPAFIDCENTWNRILKLKIEFEKEMQAWKKEKKGGQEGKIVSIKSKRNEPTRSSFINNYFEGNSEDKFIKYLTTVNPTSGESNELKRIREGIKANVFNEAGFNKFKLKTEILNYYFPNERVGYNAYCKVCRVNSGELCKKTFCDVSDEGGYVYNLCKIIRTMILENGEGLEKIKKEKIPDSRKILGDIYTPSVVSSDFDKQYNELKEESERLKNIQGIFQQKSKELFEKLLQEANSRLKKLNVAEKLGVISSDPDDATNQWKSEEIENIKNASQEAKKACENAYKEMDWRKFNNYRKDIKKIKESLDSVIRKGERGADVINKSAIERKIKTVLKKQELYKEKIFTACSAVDISLNTWEGICADVEKSSNKILILSSLINDAQESSRKAFLSYKASMHNAEEDINRILNPKVGCCIANEAKEISANDILTKVKNIKEKNQKLKSEQNVVETIRIYCNEKFEQSKNKNQEGLAEAYVCCVKLCYEAITQIYMVIEKTALCMEYAINEIDMILKQQGSMFDKIINLVGNLLGNSNSGASGTTVTVSSKKRDSGLGKIKIVLEILAGASVPLVGVFFGAAGIPILGWIMVGIIGSSAIANVVGTFI